LKLTGSTAADTHETAPPEDGVHYTLSYSFSVDELTSLARAAGRGDRDALARLVRQTQGDVWRFCAHLVDPAAADDLAQETYLRAIPALRRFRGDAQVRTWLLSIARRVCAAEFSARTRDRELAARLLTAPTAGLGQPPPEPGAQTTVDLLLAAVRRAADEGMGALVVEQHVHRVLQIADRVYVLRRGRVEFTGTAEEARSNLDEIQKHYLATGGGPNAHEHR